MKRHYTKEQLAFYFRKLQDKIGRMPREEDMNKAAGYPSITVYRERFGSWNRACDLFGNKLLIEKKCKHCKAVFHTKRKNWKYCSEACQRAALEKTRKRKDKILLKKTAKGKCVICGFSAIVEFHALKGKDTPAKLAKLLRKQPDEVIILCPNHHQMVHKKRGMLERTEQGWNIK
ncbi:MAG: hypothetical protein V1725_06640 [archaeon]